MCTHCCEKAGVNHVIVGDTLHATASCLRSLKSSICDRQGATKVGDGFAAQEPKF